MLSGWNKNYLHLQFEIDVELRPMRCAIVKHQESCASYDTFPILQRRHDAVHAALHYQPRGNNLL